MADLFAGEGVANGGKAICGLLISGVILTDQIRAIDRQSRIFDFIARVPDADLYAVREVLGLLMGIFKIASDDT